HDPDFVPELIYPEYIPLEDEHILLAEEQPLPPVVSPIAEFSGYVVESDPKEDPEEYEEDEAEDGPVDYPMDGGDDRDDEDDSDSLGYDRLCLSTLGSRYEVGESSTKVQGVNYRFTDTVEAEMRHRGIREVGYGIRDTLIDPAEAVPDMASMTLEKVNTRVAELAELYEHDTQDLYALLEDAQDGRSRISQRVSMDSQRVDLLMGDRMTLQEIVWIVKEEAYAADEACAQLVGFNQTAHHELQTLREQSQIVETLRVMRDMRREMGDMQAKLLALRGPSRREGQP
nr:hypothetical protein [Tanacetum cinerariifolium]